MADTVLTLRNATKRFGNVTVFKNLNLQIEKGSVTVVHGPSGCGKTTLLMCAALLEPLSSGQVLLGDVLLADGSQILEERLCRERMGIVFQDFYLWDNKTVMRNMIEAPISVRGLSRIDAEERALSISKILNIHSDLICKYPPELSRGQRQRVAIARTLLMEPDIILLDEASASLDEGLIKQLAEIIQVLKSQGRTILTITHDRHFASKIGDCVIEFTQLLESVTK